MTLVLSPPKIVLLAVQQAAKADIDSLAVLASQHGNVLRKELLLRILLTYLPETLRSAEYVSFIQEIESSEFANLGPVEVDCASVHDLTDDEASKKVRKLRLLPLAPPDAPGEVAEDSLTLFLLHRSYRVDEQAGLLDQLPDLLVPFLGHAPLIRSWMISILLPLLRRNCEYYPQYSIPQTLLAFQRLPDRTAVNLLLSQTGVREEDHAVIGRDLRGLIGPWLYSDTRWKRKKVDRGAEDSQASLPGDDESQRCPGWEQVLEWLVDQAAKSWKVAVSAVEQWDGPGDIDLGGYGDMRLEEKDRKYLRERYTRAALAAAYLIPEASTEALTGAHTVAAKVTVILGQDPMPSIHAAASLLSPVSELRQHALMSSRNATHLRNDLLSEENVLTSPCRATTQLLGALILSAFLLTRAGAPCSVRRAGELALLQDEREQKAEAVKFIHAISNSGAKHDDKYWIKARNELLWLRDWGMEEDSGSDIRPFGALAQVKKEFLEVEILKALLADTKYTLARSLYEDPPETPLPRKLLQDTIFSAAMNAYDNASNPNRTRGGVKKCDEIIHAFPKSIERSMVATQRTEALLKATQSLSEYRLVLKQGEPFTPVVLRIHSDPISIIGRILEQNSKSYTRIQDLLDLGRNIVEAGLTVRDKAGHSALTPEQEPEQRASAERRITAMCIDAALTEDDFETAYSYVVNRLVAISETARRKPSTASAITPSPRLVDDWSWKAALQAGKYRRTARTVRPTHLGTSSANPDIRHLEQRIECLATALRIAPASTLQEILNAFRRCEEELDAAVAAEAAQEDAWDAAADDITRVSSMPGGFVPSPSPPAGRRAAGKGHSARHQPAEEAPMSLFDLSRASARAAQRNFSALSSLQQSIVARAPEASQGGGSSSGEGAGSEDGLPKRARKRDQLREAAVGAMVSGVGWLVGAQPVDRSHERE